YQLQPSYVGQPTPHVIWDPYINAYRTPYRDCTPSDACCWESPGYVINTRNTQGNCNEGTAKPNVSKTVQYDDRGQPYKPKNDALDISRLTEKPRIEQVLMALSDSVEPQVVTLNRRCIEKGSIVVYGVTADGYVLQVEATPNLSGTNLSLAVWVISRRP